MDFDFIEDEDLRAKAVDAHKASMDSLNLDLESKIEAAVSGLKSKNEELLGEKKSIQERLAEFGDIDDPKKALEALNFIRDNADAQLIKDGKIEEVLEKRTSQLRSDHTAKLEELQQQLQQTAQEGSTYKQMFEGKMIEDSLRAAAIKEGVRPEAITDILLRGKGTFTLSAANEVEARDANGSLVKNKDNIVVTPANWVKGLKEEAPHYWPDSTGAGVSGRSGSAGDINAKLAELADKGDMDGFNKLRKKQLSK